MDMLLIAVIAILLGLILVLLAGWILWPLAIRNAPYVGVSERVIRCALSLSELRPAEVVLDLGCGDGRVLRLAAREFGALGQGVEFDPLRVRWARWLNRLAGLEEQVQIQHGDMFQADLSQVDVVFAFLCPEMMVNLAPKLKAELKPGSRIVSCMFALPGLEAARQDGKCFLYRI